MPKTLDTMCGVPVRRQRICNCPCSLVRGRRLVLPVLGNHYVLLARVSSPNPRTDQRLSTIIQRPSWSGLYSGLHFLFASFGSRRTGCCIGVLHASASRGLCVIEALAFAVLFCWAAATNRYTWSVWGQKQVHSAIKSLMYHAACKVSRVCSVRYRYSRYRYGCHTELTELSGTGIDVTELTELSGTGIDVPKLPQCPVPV